MSEGSTQTMPKYRPWADIVEKDDGTHILLDMPGVSKETLVVDIDEKDLEISATTNYPSDPFAGTKERASHVEFGGGRYHQRFTLADDVDRERISAVLRNGVLDVHLPRSEKSLPRRIEIQAG